MFYFVLVREISASIWLWLSLYILIISTAVFYLFCAFIHQKACNNSYKDLYFSIIIDISPTFRFPYSFEMIYT